VYFFQKYSQKLLSKLKSSTILNKVLKQLKQKQFIFQNPNQPGFSEHFFLVFFVRYLLCFAKT
jgi:hypothetical protein